MGYVVGQPRIVKLRTTAPGVAPAIYRWFAMVGSGVNNYTVANALGDFGSGNPALFLLALDKPVGTSWVEGTNYYRIVLPVSSLSTTNATGLVNFQTTFGTQGQVNMVF